MKCQESSGCSASCASPASWSRGPRPLLEQAVAWLLAQRLPGFEDSSYASWLCADRPPEPTRSAWCYGDPGVAAALLLTGL